MSSSTAQVEGGPQVFMDIRIGDRKGSCDLHILTTSVIHRAQYIALP